MTVRTWDRAVLCHGAVTTYSEPCHTSRVEEGPICCVSTPITPSLCAESAAGAPSVLFGIYQNTAVDEDLCAIDVAGLGRSQKCHGRGHFGGLTEPTNRDPSDVPFQQSLRGD